MAPRTPRRPTSRLGRLELSRAHWTALEVIKRLLAAGYARPGLHRLVPASIAFGLTDGYAWLSQKKGSREFSYIKTFVSDLHDVPADSAAAKRLARRCLSEKARIIEMFWRPWLMTSGTVEADSHFREALASDRGVIALVTHTGPIYAAFPTLRRHGLPMWVVVGRHHYEDMPLGYEGRFMLHGRSYLEATGPGQSNVMWPPDVFSRMAEHLQLGEPVTVAFDVAGSMPTPFLGRTVSLASGAAQLADQTGALVVPMVMSRRRHRPHLRFEPPLDPRDYAGPLVLQAELARVVERWVRTDPRSTWPVGAEAGGPPSLTTPLASED